MNMLSKYNAGWIEISSAYAITAAKLWIAEAKREFPEIAPRDLQEAFAREVEHDMDALIVAECAAFMHWTGGEAPAFLAADEPTAGAARIPRGWSAPTDAFWAALEKKVADREIPDDLLLGTIEEAAKRLPGLVEAMDVAGLADLFEAAMGAAALAGAKAGIEKTLAASADFEPLADAVAKLDRKTPVAARLSSEAWGRLPVALRDRAQFSAYVESVKFLANVQDKLQKRLTQEKEKVAHGEAFVDRDSFIRDMRKIAEEEGIQTTGPSGRGGVRDIRSVKRLGLIYDTQTKSAAEYARWKMGQDPDVLDEFPAWRFVRVESVKTPRDWHAQFEGAVRLKSDTAFWSKINQDFGVPWGPWGWNCGHDVEEVDRDEAEKLGLIKPGEAPNPVEKEFNEQLEADAEGWEPDQVATMKSAFGDQIDARGGKLRWQGSVVRDLVDRTLADSGWNGKAISLGKATARTVEAAAPMADLRGTQMKLEPGVIRKTWRDHGPKDAYQPGSGEKRGDQAPLTKTDYELLPHVWRDPDAVRAGNAPGDLVFEKRVAGQLIGATWTVSPGKTMLLKSVYKKL